MADAEPSPDPAKAGGGYGLATATFVIDVEHDQRRRAHHLRAHGARNWNNQLMLAARWWLSAGR